MVERQIAVTRAQPEQIFDDLAAGCRHAPAKKTRLAEQDSASAHIFRPSPLGRPSVNLPAIISSLKHQEAIRCCAIPIGVSKGNTSSAFLYSVREKPWKRKYLAEMQKPRTAGNISRAAENAAWKNHRAYPEGRF